MKKSILIATAILFLLIIFTVVKIYPFISAMSKFEVVEYDKNLTLVFGGGGNTGILTGEKEVLVIDSKIMGGKSKLFELVKQKAGNKPIILVNTHLHADHSQGNSLYKGNTIIAGAYTKEQWIAENGEEGMPTEWVKDSKEIQVGDETVIIRNKGQAHTYNDTVVFLKKRKILFFGDLLMIGMHPFLKKKDGSSITLYLKKQNETMDEFQPEKIVPGHGRTGDAELVKEFQEYFTDTKSVAEGKSEPDKIEEKYKHWIPFLSMSGTRETINYWREELKK
ncbi:MAG: MBL fold metallo-hydrolase [Leptospira sp.]|nr:MBL fold metallo-hydrolase [Leptospira sp.]